MKENQLKAEKDKLILDHDSKVKSLEDKNKADLKQRDDLHQLALERNDLAHKSIKQENEEFKLKFANLD